MEYWHVEDQIFTVGDGHEVSSKYGTLVALGAGMWWWVAGSILFVPMAAFGSTVGPGRIPGVVLLTIASGCFGVMAVWYARVLLWRWRTRSSDVFSPKVYALTEWLGLLIGLAAGLALGISWTS